MELDLGVVISCLLFVPLEHLEGPQAQTVKNTNLIKVGICEKRVSHDRIACGLDLLPFIF